MLSRVEKSRRVILLFLTFTLTAAAVPSPSQSNWKELKGQHFIIYHVGLESQADDILRSAERYYKKIAANLGYSRMEEFWTFEKRCQIFVYPTRESFRQFQPQAPEWSGGFADYQKRQIVGFLDSGAFVKTALPHEMAHLILRDYLGPDVNLPMWLDEGVALSMEEVRREKLEAVVWSSFQERSFIPISKLTHMRVQLARHHDDVQLYYAEAALIVSYLLDNSRKEEFITFCRNLRDGFDVDQSLSRSYGKRLSSMKLLERAFINELSTQFR